MVKFEEKIIGVPTQLFYLKNICVSKNVRKYKLRMTNVTVAPDAVVGEECSLCLRLPGEYRLLLPRVTTIRYIGLIYIYIYVFT